MTSKGAADQRSGVVELDELYGRRRFLLCEVLFRGWCVYCVGGDVKHCSINCDEMWQKVGMEG